MQHEQYIIITKQHLSRHLTWTWLRMDWIVCWFPRHGQMELKATLSTTSWMEKNNLHSMLGLMTLPSLYLGSMVAAHIQLAWSLILHYTVLKLVQWILPLVCSIMCVPLYLSSQCETTLLCFADSLEMQVYPSNLSPYSGQVFKLTCSITLLGTLTGTPLISWQGPTTLLVPLLSSSSEQVVTSNLMFNPINSSDEGGYTCTARLENFPFSVQRSLTVYIDNQSAYVTVLDMCSVNKLHAWLLNTW